MIRLIAAGLILGALLFLFQQRKKWAILAVFIYLPFLAEIRRLLLYVTGWSGFDPLTLVAPTFAAYILLATHPTHLGRSYLTKQVGLVLVIMGIQVLNPIQGNPLVGLGGALFYMMPILWFYVGRRMADDELVETIIFRILPIIGAATAAMGLYQASTGFLAHQQRWIDSAGYAALHITADLVRPFSTFSSGQEFSMFMQAITLISLVGVLFQRRLLLIVPLLICPLAMFAQGSRGATVTLMLGIIGLLAAKSRRIVLMIPLVIIFGTIAIILGRNVLESLATQDVNARYAPIIAHQVDGLLNPLDEGHSTATSHANMKMHGIIRGIIEPWGQGLGSTTLAASKFGGNAVGNMEIDFSNIFTATGIVGGVAYLWLIISVARMGYFMWQATGDTNILTLAAILFAGFGQWTGGVLYAIGPLVWLMIGRLDRMYLERRETLWAEHEPEEDPEDNVERDQTK